MMGKGTRNKISVSEANVRLPELVERASAGEEFILCHNGKPKAKLVPFATEKKTYIFGAGKGKRRGLKKILNEPLPQEVIDSFYNNELFPSPRKRSE